MTILKRILFGFGRGLRNGLVALGALSFIGIGVSFGDWLGTVPGSGTNFAGVQITVGGLAAQYAAGLVCDFTLGKAQCQAVDSSGNASVKDTALLAAVQAAIPAGANPTGIAMPNAATSLVKGTTAAMTGTTSTQIIAAVSGKVIYVTHVSCVNSHATVGTLVSIQDGSGGTVLTTLAAAAVFGGDEKVGTTPLFWTTSGNGLYAADMTTGANVFCDAAGYAQ